MTGWQWDVLGGEEESIRLSIHLLGECCLLCCLGPASALGHGFCWFVKHLGQGRWCWTVAGRRVVWG